MKQLQSKKPEIIKKIHGTHPASLLGYGCLRPEWNRGRWLRLVHLVMLVLLVLLPLPSHAKNKSTFRVAHYSTPPLSFTHDQENHAGLCMDLLQEMAVRGNWLLEFDYGSWADQLKKPEAGRVNFLLAIIIATAEGKNKDALEAIDNYRGRWRRDKRPPYHLCFNKWFHFKSSLEAPPPVVLKPEEKAQQKAHPAFRPGYDIDYTRVVRTVIIAALLLFVSLYWVNRRAKHRLFDIIEFLPDATFVINTKKQVIAWNKAIEEMTGVSKAEVLGKGDYEYAIPLYGKRRPILIDLIESPAPETESKYDFIHRHGDRMLAEVYVPALFEGKGAHVWVTASALRDALGRRYGAIESIRDITERKHNEEKLAGYREHLEDQVKKRTEELAQAKDQAETANRTKSAFLASMTHELRTPLNAILGFSEMLGRDPGATNAQHKMISIINHSGEHLLGMINDVLDLSKIEAGRINLESEAFDLSAMLEDIGRMFDARAEKALLRFDLDIDPMRVHHIKSDPGKLRQILINLLGNAVKFTEHGGVTLRARTRSVVDDHSMVTLQIEVEDSGPGIAPEQLESIFESFHQADHSPSAVKGTGLGLAISKSFVELMGGEIRAESNLGEGSLFRVELQVALADATEVCCVETERSAVLGLEPGQPDWRILVVEDNPGSRLLLTTLLGHAGFETREATNGKEAITIFEQWHPHFIWMDIRMPIMNGYEATAKIRSLPGGNEVKIVALTASVFKEQHKGILAAGCNEVMHKPYKSQAIFITMAKQLGVRYLYEEGTKESASRRATEPVLHLTGELVMSLSAELRQALTEAARNLDVSATAHVIERIRIDSPDIADGLLRLSETFQFGHILSLLGE